MKTKMVAVNATRGKLFTPVLLLMFLLFDLTIGGTKMSNTFPNFTQSSANPVLSPSGKETLATFSSVVKVGSNWYMYYTYNPTGGNDYRIGRATSSDGVNWVKDTADNPILTVGASGAWDSGHVAVPVIWIEGSTWYMLYRGLGTAPNSQIGLATSSDGITWTKYAENPVLSGTSGQWDDNSIDPWGLIKVGTTYFLYYSTIIGANRSVGIATSTNLTTWTKDTNNPILTGGRYCVFPLYINGYYHLLVPHYTQGEKFAQIELYRDTAPTFYPNSRQFLGIIKTTSIEGNDFSNQDTPWIVTDDITRSSVVDTGDAYYFYYAAENDPSLLKGYPWYTNLMISDGTDQDFYGKTPNVNNKDLANVGKIGIGVTHPKYDLDIVDPSVAQIGMRALAGTFPFVLGVGEASGVFCANVDPLTGDLYDPTKEGWVLAFDIANDRLVVRRAPANGALSNILEINSTGIIPSTDNAVTCGNSSNRWSLVRGAVVTAGDLAFEETACHICGKKFEEGDNLSLTVREIGPNGTQTVPIHTGCQSN